MKTLVLLMAAIFVAGCATAPVHVGEASPVPTHNRGIAFSRFSSDSGNCARVTIVRDSGMLNAAVPMMVSVDGEELAIFRPSETLTFFIPAGDYIFALQPKPLLLGAIEEKTFSFVGGRHYYFRISASTTGNDGLMPTTLVK